MPVYGAVDIRYIVVLESLGGTCCIVEILCHYHACKRLKPLLGGHLGTCAPAGRKGIYKSSSVAESRFPLYAAFKVGSELTLLLYGVDNSFLALGQRLQSFITQLHVC